MNRIIQFTVIGLLCLTQSLFAQEDDSTPKFVNEFLNIGVGARAHGMFGSVVANTDDVTSAFWNPAGLSEIDVPFQASAMHAEWFGGISNYDYLSFGKTLSKSKSSFGSVSLIRLGIDNIPNTLSLIGPDGTVNYNNITEFSAADYALMISYGRKWSEKLRVGGNIKVINRTIGKFATAWGFGIDLGAKFLLSDRITIGVMGKDITGTFNAWSFNFDEDEKIIFQQTGNIIPESSTEVALPRFIVGAAYYKPSPKLSLLFEADLNISTNGTKAGLVSGSGLAVDPTFGMELGMRNKIFIRAGLGNIQRLLNEVNAAERSLSFQPNVGLGVKLGRITVDYALTNLGSAGSALVSHIFSVRLDFESRSTKEEELGTY